MFSPRINWEQLPVREHGPDAEAEDAEVSAWLTRLQEKHALGEPEVLLITGNGVHPAFCLAFRHVSACPQVISSRPEAWLLCEADGWVLEFQRFHDGWWWGRLPDGA